MSEPIPNKDNHGASPLSYTPKWRRESAPSVIPESTRMEASESGWPDLDALVAKIQEERRRLGRAPTLRHVSIDDLRANPRNPRRNYSDAELDELTESIRERGIIQPIVVRAVLEERDTYEIIAGERRWRAAQRAGLQDIPIVLLDVSDSEALEIAIIENVQRTDLNPLEEAAGYQVLADEYGHSQEAIAKIVGKSRSYIANILRLLKLPDEVKDHIHSGKLTASHARSLVAQPDAQELAKQIVEHGFTVREVEALAHERACDAGKGVKARTRVQKGAEALALEKRLSDLFGLSVNVGRRQNGVLQVRYRSFEQLEETLRRLERC